jgi:thiol-disulfide isomerase/thioredoxin
MRYLLLFIIFPVSLFAQQHRLTVVPISRDQLQKIIVNRNDTVLFLNIWATWCTPCIEEFPDIIKLADQIHHEGKNVEFISVSADYPDEVQSHILPFLNKFPEIPFRVYVADFKSQDDFIDALNPDWSGAVPATFLYSADGKLQHMLLGQHTFDQFKDELEKLLPQH